MTKLERLILNSFKEKDRIYFIYPNEYNSLEIIETLKDMEYNGLIKINGKLAINTADISITDYALTFL